MTYREVDFQGNVNLLDEARREDVSKFLYISALGAQEMPHLKVVEAKQAFVRELRRSGMDHTVIYPNGYFSDMLEIFRMAKKGRGYVLSGGRYKINPIHGADLASVCANAAESDRTDIAVGGPDTFTYRETLELACEVLGTRARITSIPLWLRDLMLVMLRRFTSERTYGPLEYFLTVMGRDMIGEPYGRHHLKDFFIENAQHEAI